MKRWVGSHFRYDFGTLRQKMLRGSSAGYSFIHVEIISVNVRKVEMETMGEFSCMECRKSDLWAAMTSRARYRSGFLS